MNSRIRFPFNTFFLNPVYVAARSLRSNYKKALPKYVQQKQCFPPTQSPSERKYASSLLYGLCLQQMSRALWLVKFRSRFEIFPQRLHSRLISNYYYHRRRICIMLITSRNFPVSSSNNRLLVCATQVISESTNSVGGKGKLLEPQMSPRPFFLLHIVLTSLLSLLFKSL